MQILPTFYSNCLALQLYLKSENDRHICFRILIQNKGEWIQDDGCEKAPYWLSDLNELNNSAIEWLSTHADMNYQGWLIREYL